MADESNGRKGTAASERARTRAASAPRDERGRFTSGGESGLPNPNPNGTASINMMQLSFQETSTNYLQGIFEEISSLKKLLSSILVVNTNMMSNDAAIAQQDALTESRRRAAAEEEKRESRFAGTGGALRGAAKTVKDSGKDLFAKSGGIGGMLSTIIGAGLLGAILMPEKTKEMVEQLQKTFGDIMDSEVMKDAIKHAGKFAENFGWDNLLVTGILGWRVGALFSAFDYIGVLVADWLGVPDANAIDEQEGGEGNVPLPQQIKNWIGERFKDTFKWVALAGLLMPGGFWALLKGSAWLVGSLLSSGMSVGGSAAAAGAALPADQKAAINKGVKGVKPGIFRRLLGWGGMLGVKGLGILGMVYGISSLVSNVMADGEINAEDLNLENALFGGITIAGLAAAFAPGLVIAILKPILGFLFSPLGIAAIAAVFTGGWLIKKIIDKIRGITARETLNEARQDFKTELRETGELSSEGITNLINQISETDTSAGPENVDKQISELLKKSGLNKENQEKLKSSASFYTQAIDEYYKTTRDDRPKTLEQLKREKKGQASEYKTLQDAEQARQELLDQLKTATPNARKDILLDLKAINQRIEDLGGVATEDPIPSSGISGALTSTPSKYSLFESNPAAMRAPTLETVLFGSRRKKGAPLRPINRGEVIIPEEPWWEKIGNWWKKTEDLTREGRSSRTGTMEWRSRQMVAHEIEAREAKIAAQAIAMDGLSKIVNQKLMGGGSTGAGQPQPIVNAPQSSSTTVVAKNMHYHGGMGNFVAIDSSAGLVAGHIGGNYLGYNVRQ